ncbi:MAG: ACT domain-containing protein [Terriglobia bacterium]
MPIVQQVTITVANRPGGLARVAETLARNRINITGLNASGANRRVRLLVSNPARAVRALKKAKVRARLEPAVAVTLRDRPGSLARAARKLAKRKININYGYGTVVRGGKRATIVFGVAKPGRAARLIS